MTYPSIEVAYLLDTSRGYHRDRPSRVPWVLCNENLSLAVDLACSSLLVWIVHIVRVGDHLLKLIEF